MVGDDGYPYGIPLSHFYDERDGLVQKFTDDQEYLEMELKNALPR